MPRPICRLDYLTGALFGFSLGYQVAVVSVRNSKSLEYLPVVAIVLGCALALRSTPKTSATILAFFGFGGLLFEYVFPSIVKNQTGIDLSSLHHPGYDQGVNVSRLLCFTLIVASLLLFAWTKYKSPK